VAREVPFAPVFKLALDQTKPAKRSRMAVITLAAKLAGRDSAEVPVNDTCQDQGRKWLAASLKFCGSK